MEEEELRKPFEERIAELKKQKEEALKPVKQVFERERKAIETHFQDKINGVWKEYREARERLGSD